MTLFVVAGHRSEADAWIKADIEKRSEAGETPLFWNDYYYVTDASRIKGFSNPHGVFVGSWRTRPDILDIVETLMIQSTNPNPSLGKIRRELLQNKPNDQFNYIPLSIVNNKSIQEAADLLSKAIDQEILDGLISKPKLKPTVMEEYDQPTTWKGFVK